MPIKDKFVDASKEATGEISQLQMTEIDNEFGTGNVNAQKRISEFAQKAGFESETSEQKWSDMFGKSSYNKVKFMSGFHSQEFFYGNTSQSLRRTTTVGLNPKHHGLYNLSSSGSVFGRTGFPNIVHTDSVELSETQNIMIPGYDNIHLFGFEMPRVPFYQAHPRPEDAVNWDDPPGKAAIVAAHPAGPAASPTPEFQQHYQNNFYYRSDIRMTYRVNDSCPKYWPGWPNHDPHYKWIKITGKWFNKATNARETEEKSFYLSWEEGRINAGLRNTRALEYYAGNASGNTYAPEEFGISHGTDLYPANFASWRLLFQEYDQGGDNCSYQHFLYGKTVEQVIQESWNQNWWFQSFFKAAAVYGNCKTIHEVFDDGYWGLPGRDSATLGPIDPALTTTPAFVEELSDQDPQYSIWNYYPSPTYAGNFPPQPQMKPGTFNRQSSLNTFGYRVAVPDAVKLRDEGVLDYSADRYAYVSEGDFHIYSHLGSGWQYLTWGIPVDVTTGVVEKMPGNVHSLQNYYMGPDPAEFEIEFLAEHDLPQFQEPNLVWNHAGDPARPGGNLGEPYWEGHTYNPDAM